MTAAALWTTLAAALALAALFLLLSALARLSLPRGLFSLALGMAAAGAHAIATVIC